VALLTHHLVDIKGDNILQEIEDESILEAFTKAEIEHPSPRKFVKDAPVYASRRFERPKTFGRAVLSDFGSAVCGDPKRNHDAQPNVYRSPEVMLKTEWSYPIDIWNVGVMVRPVYFSGPVTLVEVLLTAANQVWDLFEGKHMFYGNDPDGKGYSTRTHLAEVVGMLGPPPLDLLKRGKRSLEFFTEDGTYDLFFLNSVCPSFKRDLLMIFATRAMESRRGSTTRHELGAVGRVSRRKE
jgi:serine/threonine-protein kinase SRPK3